MFNAIRLLYPQAVIGDDFSLRDDGNGPFISYWNVAKLGPQPTPDAIAAAIATADVAAALEANRIKSIDAAIVSDTTIQTLKPMSNAEFDAWWTANVTNAAQAIAVLKRLTRLIIRRL